MKKDNIIYMPLLLPCYPWLEFDVRAFAYDTSRQELSKAGISVLGSSPSTKITNAPYDADWKWSVLIVIDKSLTWPQEGRFAVAAREFEIKDGKKIWTGTKASYKTTAVKIHPFADLPVPKTDALFELLKRFLMGKARPGIASEGIARYVSTPVAYDPDFDSGPADTEKSSDEWFVLRRNGWQSEK